ncbi:MAG: 30S ribosomal protein S6 [Defluviitaleaceae bacterium]|nr:30S ribosomal protein S6 [Defluviitaleaceae bacterium]
MNKYELGVIVRADLDEETFQAEMTRVKGLIERFEGTIDKVDDWGRRKLAYPIKKLTEGMYTFITFTSEAGAPREIEARLRLMENVLRFLVIRKDELEATAQPAAKPAAPAPEAEAVEPEAEVVEAEAAETTEEPAATEE